MSEADEQSFAKCREAMVMVIAVYASLCADEIGNDRLDDRIMRAMASVPRHVFIPDALQPWAYDDLPLPIGCGKTISQPFVVALMTHLLGTEPHDRVLEIGTGLGYQTAVLAELTEQVFSIEIVNDLAVEAEQRLCTLGYDNVKLRIGEGSRGWAEHAPFDKIIVTAAPEWVPRRLLEQLRLGGRMVLPVGPEDEQQLVVVEKGIDGRVRSRDVLGVRFSRLIISHSPFA